MLTNVSIKETNIENYYLKKKLKQITLTPLKIYEIAQTAQLFFFFFTATLKSLNIYFLKLLKAFDKV